MSVSTFLIFGSLCEWGDDLAKAEKRFVNVNRFFSALSCGASLTRAFTARKVDELEFAGHQVFYIVVVYNLSLKCENGMRATRGMIKIMRSHNFILNSFVIQLYCVLGIVASKYK